MSISSGRVAVVLDTKEATGAQPLKVSYASWRHHLQKAARPETMVLLLALDPECSTQPTGDVIGVAHADVAWT